MIFVAIAFYVIMMGATSVTLRIEKQLRFDLSVSEKVLVEVILSLGALFWPAILLSNIINYWLERNEK